MSVSPTKIDDCRDCVRIAAWDIVDPHKWEQGDAAKLGDEVHEAFEDYTKAGVQPEPGTPVSELFLKGLPYAPKPRTGGAERRVKWIYNGIEYSFRKDWFGRTSDLAGLAEGSVADMPAAVDFKTSGDISNGVSSVEEHYQDSQSLLYALHSMVSTGADQTYNRWLQIQSGAKKGKKVKALPIDALMTLPKVKEAFTRLVEPHARFIEHVREEHRAGRFTKLNVLALPPNVRRCKKYTTVRDGVEKYTCPRYGQCEITRDQELDALDALEGEDHYMHQVADIFSQLQQSQGALPAPSAPAAAPAAPSVVAQAPAGALPANPIGAAFAFPTVNPTPAPAAPAVSLPFLGGLGQVPVAEPAAPRIQTSPIPAEAQASVPQTQAPVVVPQVHTKAGGLETAAAVLEMAAQAGRGALAERIAAHEKHARHYDDATLGAAVRAVLAAGGEVTFRQLG